MKVTQNIILHLNPMQAYLQRNDLQNVIFIKGCISKNHVWKWISKILFIKYILRFSKDYFKNPNSIWYYASKAFCYIYKAFFENMF
jgi:hypothetical protein